MDETTIALSAVGGLALLAALSPIRIPLAVLLAMLVIRDDLSLDSAALVAGIGGSAGRVMLAFEARRESSKLGTRARTGDLAGLRDRPKRGSGYPTLTFLAGLTPVIPERFLFGVLGALRLPLTYAVAGALIGQYLLLLLGGWIFISLAEALTNSQRDAALVLGVTAILFIIMRTTRRFDSAAWRTERKLRMRPEGWEAQFVNMMKNDGRGGSGPSIPFFGGMGAGGPEMPHQTDDEYGDIIEAEVIDEDDSDDYDGLLGASEGGQPDERGPSQA